MKSGVVTVEIYMDIITSYLVFGTGPSFVHCGIYFYILYTSHVLG